MNDESAYFVADVLDVDHDALGSSAKVDISTSKHSLY